MNRLLNISKRSNLEIPLVSIVCTAFNQVKFIKETLDGFLIQKTTFPFEIIVHDDASTDGTKETLVVISLLTGKGFSFE